MDETRIFICKICNEIIKYTKYYTNKVAIHLKTHNIRYYLNYESWKRENITPVGDETKIYMTTIGEDAYQVYGTTVSRRDDYVLNTNVTKIINWSYFGTTEEREFVGWTLNKKYEDNLITSKDLIVKVKPG